MTFASGQMLAHYRLVEKVGEGGMGVVWKALDTSLGREVAIKILPDVFAKDHDRVARFEREARLLASLSHPAIAAIYGLHVSGDVRFLVMELVPGEDLARVLARGPLPAEEVVRVGRRVAEALEAAHESGVVHRDLKPANVVLTAAGEVKVLDFGLAKAFETQASSPTSSLSPTITSFGTMGGVILGTASYMSPEQARGKPVDKRADVWSFGCILYEALAAKRPFEGETVSDTLAAVLKLEPDWSAIPTSAPGALVDLARRCLTKDPRERLRDIGEARIVLGGIEKGDTGRDAASPASVARRSSVLPWTLAAAFAALAIAAVASWRTGGEPARHVMRFTSQMDLVLPNMRGAPFALSPDGARLVYTTAQTDTTVLNVRDLDQVEGRLIPGTEGATLPFLSPDGRHVGFITADKLKRVSLGGGAPLTLADLADSRGASWGPDGFIYFTPTVTDPLYRIPAGGGTAEPFTTIDAARNERSHRWPYVLPGNEAVLFTIGYLAHGFDRSSIGIKTPGAQGHEVLIESGTWARYLPTGHLAYLDAATLYVVPFDLDGLTIAGPPVPMIEGVGWLSGTGGANFDVASNGTLVYIADEQSSRRRLLRVSRDGTSHPLSDELRPWNYPRFTPDGGKVVVEIEAAEHDIWALDVARGTLSRLTFGGDSHGPIVSPDGASVFYDTTSRSGGAGMFRRLIDGSGEETRISSARSRQRPLTMTPDGKTLLHTEIGENRSADIYAISLDGEPAPQPVLNQPHEEWGAHLSPDGRWLAYVTTETGRSEVYVRPYPVSGSKWQISIDGGRMPLWSRDGRELFFIRENTLMAVPIETRPAFAAGRPVRLFEGSYHFPLDRILGFDVAPDGRSFAMVAMSDSDQRPVVNVVLNWFEEVRGAVEAAKR